MSSNDYQEASNESEINLRTVLVFLAFSWRWILLGVFLGPLLAVGYIKSVSPFTAEAILENVCKENKCPVDIISWRYLSEMLPAIAVEWFVSPEFKYLHQGDNRDWMLSAKWWSKNVIPQYGLSQEDMKKFHSPDDRMQSALVHINTIKLIAQGGTHELALMRLDQLLSFIRDVGTYLQFRSLMDAYKGETLTGVADIAAYKSSAEIEFSYQETKTEEIKRLLSMDSGRVSKGEVKVNIESSDVRYLSLRSQLNANQIILRDLREKNSRLNDDSVKLDVITSFLGQATGLVGERFSGVSASELSNRLLKVQAEVRAGLAEDNKIGILAMDRIKADLTRAGLSFSLFLPVISSQVFEPLITLKEILVASCVGGGASP